MFGLATSREGKRRLFAVAAAFRGDVSVAAGLVLTAESGGLARFCCLPLAAGRSPSHGAGSISPLRFFLADDGRRRIVRTHFDGAYPLFVRWLLHALSLSFVIVQFFDPCSNPAIAGDGSASCPVWLHLLCSAYPRHMRPFSIF